MNSGKLLKITDERYIFIIENEEGEYVSKDMQIRYRNIGSNYEIAIINESPVRLNSKGNVEVLDAVGNPKFNFPAVWLDTDKMKILGLAEKGILKLE